MNQNRTRKRKRLYQMQLDESGTGVFAISLVSEPAIEELFIYLSKQPQLVTLAEVNTEKRLLIGPVLIPNKSIPRIDEETGEEYDIMFTPEVVEKAAQLFLQNQKNNNATIEHTDKRVDDVSVVESWIVADPEKDKSSVYGMSLPKGSWVAMMKINNDKVWEDYVKSGKVKGFSLEGLFGHELVQAEWGVPDVPESESAQTREEQYPHIQLSKDHDIAFAIETVNKIRLIILEKELELDSYSDYPDAVKNAAEKGIKLNEESGNRCATQVGKIRAQQLASGEPVSLDTVKRMYSYLSRAAEYYNPEDESACGTISYLLWGGEPALKWSESKLKELEEMESAISITSTYAGQWGEERDKREY